jgi:hypothetical protein
MNLYNWLITSAQNRNTISYDNQYLTGIVCQVRAVFFLCSVARNRTCTNQVTFSDLVNE